MTCTSVACMSMSCMGMARVRGLDASMGMAWRSPSHLLRLEGDGGLSEQRLPRVRRSRPRQELCGRAELHGMVGEGGRAADECALSGNDRYAGA